LKIFAKSAEGFVVRIARGIEDGECSPAGRFNAALAARVKWPAAIGILQSAER
jgi:hypothetical protein